MSNCLSVGFSHVEKPHYCRRFTTPSKDTRPRHKKHCFSNKHENTQIAAHLCARRSHTGAARDSISHTYLCTAAPALLLRAILPAAQVNHGRSRSSIKTNLQRLAAAAQLRAGSGSRRGGLHHSVGYRTREARAGRARCAAGLGDGAACGLRGGTRQRHGRAGARAGGTCC